MMLSWGGGGGGGTREFGSRGLMKCWFAIVNDWLVGPPPLLPLLLPPLLQILSI